MYISEEHVSWLPLPPEFVVQMTRAEKRAIAEAARRFGLNVSELMRAAARRYEPTEAEGQLDVLLAEVKRSTAQAHTALDDALAFVEASEARIKTMSERAERERKTT